MAMSHIGKRTVCNSASEVISQLEAVHPAAKLFLIQAVVLAGQICVEQLETSNTVLLQSADDVRQFNRSEDSICDAVIKSYVDAGVNVFFCGGTVSAHSLHFLDKYDCVCISTGSKFELKRIAHSMHVPVIQHREQPAESEIGLIAKLEPAEFGGRLFTLVETVEQYCGTLILRGSSDLHLEESESAVKHALAVLSGQLTLRYNINL
uniref:Probable T-complex protein 1 subunit theta n=1 Tax=Dermatophagoides pteronyssinus TaxID=6956 RepID=A0A6P6XYS7_DERPT|nr:probable T-complex protein 1 subunit theta [Dermatophagoides pteronyssinus]